MEMERTYMSVNFTYKVEKNKIKIVKEYMSINAKKITVMVKPMSKS